MKLLLPDALPLNPSLPSDVDVVRYSVRDRLPAQYHDAEAIVLWSISPRWLKQASQDLTAVRWVQTLTAGADAVVAAGFRSEAVITTGVGLHDGPVAEHALGLILAAARRLDLALDAQRAHRWATELTLNQPLGNTERFTMVAGSRIVIWGFGGIGQRLASYLAPLGAEVIGVAQSAGTRAGFPVVTAAELPDILPSTDVLVNILPATPETAGIVDADILAQLPRKAWLVNVGRGATVDEAALRTALWDGVIAGAALDVTAAEPLPVDDLIWDAPNLIHTPHSAGGRPQGSEALIEANLTALRAGEPLRNTVSR